MKKILLVLIVSGLFMSCDMVYEIHDSLYESAIHGQVLYYGDFPEMESFEDISAYLEANVTYYNDDRDYHISPVEETIKSGKGNCEAFALAFMNIAYIKLGVKCDFVSVDDSGSNQRAVLSGGKTTHSVVSYNNQLYSAYTGQKITDYKAGYIYYFDDVISFN